MAHPIRILIVDDHALVRSAIESVLGDEPDFAVVGQATNGTEALRLVQLHQPDIVVMDVDMPRVNGINATRLILGIWPAVRVVGLSFDTSEEAAREMFEAGAAGYVPKSAPISELVSAIREATPLGV